MWAQYSCSAKTIILYILKKKCTMRKVLRKQTINFYVYHPRYATFYEKRKHLNKEDYDHSRCYSGKIHYGESSNYLFKMLTYNLAFAYQARLYFSDILNMTPSFYQNQLRPYIADLLIKIKIIQYFLNGYQLVVTLQIIYRNFSMAKTKLEGISRIFCHS